MGRQGSGRTDTADARRHAGARAHLVLVTDDVAEEQRLVAGVREGDREAFGALIQRFLPRAYALAYRLVRHREDAEDLVQDAFLSALQHFDSFDPGRPFWPWFSRIVVNRGLDLLDARGRRTTTALAEELEDRRAAPDEVAERSDFLERFRQTLTGLPPKRRLVMELYELEQLEVAEIAEILDSSPATVRWHLHAARRQLRKALSHVHMGAS